MEGPLKNARHERFAVLVAGGSTQADAYREVWPGSMRWKDKSVHEKASKLAAKVGPRVVELQQAAAARADYKKDRMVEYLVSVMETPVDDVSGNSKLAQEVSDEVRGETLFRKVKMPAKLQAADMLCKILGFYAPERVDGTFSFPPDSTVFQALRRGAGKA